jgi:23S rRNA (cytosine1962-C5)-methyltransferase
MLLGEVAAASGLAIQVLQARGKPPDHPISAACLESDSLKCFVCAVGG